MDGWLIQGLCSTPQTPSQNRKGIVAEAYIFWFLIEFRKEVDSEFSSLAHKERERECSLRQEPCRRSMKQYAASRVPLVGEYTVY